MFTWWWWSRNYQTYQNKDRDRTTVLDHRTGIPLTGGQLYVVFQTFGRPLFLRWLGPPLSNINRLPISGKAVEPVLMQRPMKSIPCNPRFLRLLPWGNREHGELNRLRYKQKLRLIPEIINLLDPDWDVYFPRNLWRRLITALGSHTSPLSRDTWHLFHLSPISLVSSDCFLKFRISRRVCLLCQYAASGSVSPKPHVSPKSFPPVCCHRLLVLVSLFILSFSNLVR